MSAQPLPPPPPPAAAPMPAPTSALSRGWLRDLMRGIRQEGVQPRDPRVKALWNLLRRRQLLARDPWARTRLRYIWQKGLNVRPRPRTTQRLLTLLRSGAVSVGGHSSGTCQPVQERQPRCAAQCKRSGRWRFGAWRRCGRSAENSRCALWPGEAAAAERFAGRRFSARSALHALSRAIHRAGRARAAHAASGCGAWPPRRARVSIQQMDRSPAHFDRRRIWGLAGVAGRREEPGRRPGRLDQQWEYAGVQNVVDGVIDATSQQYPVKMAELGVQAIVDIVKNGTTPEVIERARLLQHRCRPRHRPPGRRRRLDRHRRRRGDLLGLIPSAVRGWCSALPGATLESDT